MNILIFGSSITWGAWDEKGGWAQRIKNDADKDVLSSGFNRYTAVYCLGVSGDTSEGLLERFEAEVKARVDKKDEVLIVVEIGMNDSLLILAENKNKVPKEKFRVNIVSLIEKAKNLRARIVFVGLTPVDKRADPIFWEPGSSYKPNLVQEYDKVLKDTCSENKVEYIELFSKFPREKYSSLLIDGIHPSTEGHSLMYTKIKKHLDLP